MSLERLKSIKIRCPRCSGYKAIPGTTDGLYKAPATLPCPRCNSCGEVDINSLTDLEKNPVKKPFFERDDNP